MLGPDAVVHIDPAHQCVRTNVKTSISWRRPLPRDCLQTDVLGDAGNRSDGRARHRPDDGHGDPHGGTDGGAPRFPAFLANAPALSAAFDVIRLAVAAAILASSWSTFPSLFKSLARAAALPASGPRIW
jgi:hypothetical protein